MPTIGGGLLTLKDAVADDVGIGLECEDQRRLPSGDSSEGTLPNKMDRSFPGFFFYWPKFSGRIKICLVGGFHFRRAILEVLSYCVVGVDGWIHWHNSLFVGWVCEVPNLRSLF